MCIAHPSSTSPGGHRHEERSLLAGVVGEPLDHRSGRELVVGQHGVGLAGLDVAVVERRVVAGVDRGRRRPRQDRLPGLTRP